MEDEGSYSYKYIQRLYQVEFHLPIPCFHSKYTFQVREYNDPPKRKVVKRDKAKTKKPRLKYRFEGLEEIKISSTNLSKVNTTNQAKQKSPESFIICKKMQFRYYNEGINQINVCQSI